MRFLRNSLIALAGLAAILTWSAHDAGDEALYPPPPGAPTVSVWVVSHGWHASLILSVGDIGLSAERWRATAPETAAALVSLARAMRAAEWLEIGWGDEGFYRADAAGALEVPPGVVAAALFSPSDSVMHVFPGLGPPGDAFPGGDIAEIAMSVEGFDAMTRAVAADFATRGGEVVDLGPGLYGFARFFDARGAYTALNTCNNWVARMLRAGGLASSGAFSTFAFGLMAELRFRNDGVY